MKPQTIRTEGGEELVVLTSREYLALRAQAGDEEAEDAMSAIIAAERMADIEAGRDHILPAWLCEAALRAGGSIMRGAREHRGLAAATLADLIGVSSARCDGIERGDTIATLAELDSISAALDLDPRWLRALERNRFSA